MPIEIRTEHQDGISTTRTQQLSVLFHYAGLQLIEIRRVGPKTLAFVHNDPECEAPDLEQSFYEPDGGYVASARDLLRADREIRRAMKPFYKESK